MKDKYKLLKESSNDWLDSELEGMLSSSSDELDSLLEELELESLSSSLSFDTFVDIFRFSPPFLYMFRFFMENDIPHTHKFD